jgi:flagellar motility protein MotE (MotC chaperone)
MMRLLQSPWIAVVLGILLYFGTTAWVLRPDRLLTEHLAGELATPEEPLRPLEPSWAFKNPEVDQLIAELRQEREAVKVRAQELQELETRLAVERAELSTITQQVFRLQQQLDADFASIREDEAGNLKRLAKVYASMSPEGAAKILLEFDDDQVVKVFALMKEPESAPILELMAKEDQNAARRVALISDRLRRLRAKPPATPPRKS